MKPTSAILALSALLLGLSACKQPATTGRESGKGGKGGPPRAVSLARAEQRPMERVVTVTGALAALDRSTLAIKVAGRLQEISVDLGSEVQPGQVIARLEPRDYELRLQLAEAAVSQARAALGLPLAGANDVTDLEEVSLVKQARALFDEASRNFERVGSLVTNKVVSDAELDRAAAEFKVTSNRVVAAREEARTRQAALLQRRAELEITRQQLTDTSLRAPYRGIVEARLANAGEYLTTGAPVVALVRTDLLRLRLEVPERQAAVIRAGQPIRFKVEGDTNQHTADITRLSPTITEPNRMLIVESNVEGRGALRPGAFVNADIVVNPREDGLAVPVEALVVFAGLEKVVTVREGKARELSVVTGRRGPDWIEIKSGLQAGEPVVLRPGNLRTGEGVIVGPAGGEKSGKASGPGGGKGAGK